MTWRLDRIASLLDTERGAAARASPAASASDSTTSPVIAHSVR